MDATSPLETRRARKREWLFIALAGLFITNAVTAELISNKLVEIPVSFAFFGTRVGPFLTIIGILPWPIVFLLTDLMNEFYGEQAVRRLSWITSALIGYCFIIVLASLHIPAHPEFGGASDEQYTAVFGQAPWIIMGSISAFLLSQLLDATLFHRIKKWTGNRFIWLRSTGSTVISQFLDSYVVLLIGFLLPGKMSLETYLTVAPTNYVLKLIIALSLTPLIYFGHWLVRMYLKDEEG